MNHEHGDGYDESHVGIHDWTHRDAKHVAKRVIDEIGENGAHDAKVVLQSRYHSERGLRRPIRRELVLHAESSAPTPPPLHDNGVLRVQPDSLADDNDYAGPPHRLDPLVLLYSFLAFLLGDGLQSAENFADCQR